MKSIYKYTLKASNRQVVSIPSQQILSVKNQHDTIVVYALVDAEAEPHNYIFTMHGTGHHIAYDIENYTFLGTVALHAGELMFHIFYKEEDQE